MELAPTSPMLNVIRSAVGRDSTDTLTVVPPPSLPGQTTTKISSTAPSPSVNCCRRRAGARRHSYTRTLCHVACLHWRPKMEIIVWELDAEGFSNEITRGFPFSVYPCSRTDPYLLQSPWLTMDFDFFALTWNVRDFELGAATATSTEVTVSTYSLRISPKDPTTGRQLSAQFN